MTRGLRVALAVAAYAVAAYALTGAAWLALGVIATIR